MSPARSRKSARRSFVAGLLGSGFVKSLGAVSLAPAILAREADAAPHLAQGRRNGRDGNPRFGLEPLGHWTFDQDPHDFRFSSDGNRLAIKLIHDLVVFDFPSMRQICRFSPAMRVGFNTFSYGGDGSTLLTLPPLRRREPSVPSPLVRVFDASTGALLHEIPVPDVDARTSRWAEGIVTSPDGNITAVRLAAAWGIEASVVAMVGRSATASHEIIYQKNNLKRFDRAFTVSNRGLIACAEQEPRRDNPVHYSIVILDARSGKRLAELQAGSSGVASLSWSVDGASLAVGANPQPAPTRAIDIRSPVSRGDDDPLWIWSVDDQKVVRTVSGFFAPVNRSGFSQNGRWLAFGRAKRDLSLGSRLTVLDIADGREVYSYETRGSEIIADVGFSPNGRNFAMIEGRRFRTFRVAE